jgi:formate dehydrogenase iron-sulfur subunit
VGALVWGNRQELLDVAKARVTTLKEEGRTSAKLYGETEAGGLHRLSIVFDEPDQYNLPANPGSPTTARAWQGIVQPLGQVAFGATILGALTAFLLARRNVRMEGVE